MKRSMLGLGLALGLVFGAISPIASPAYAAEISLTGPSVLKGLFAVDSQLTADVTNDPNVTVTYRWFADGAEIIGETGQQFMPTVAEAGRRIKVIATLSRANYSSRTVELDPGIVVEATPVTISGGSWRPHMSCYLETSSASDLPIIGWNVWIPCGTANSSFGYPVSYQTKWYRNSSQITGIFNATSYNVKPADAGAFLSAEHIARYSNGATFVGFERAIIPVPPDVVPGTVSISGNLAEGQTLNAVSSGVDPAASLSYLWYRDFKTIPEAITATYQVTSADLNRRIQVLVLAERAGHTSKTTLSAAIGNLNSTQAAESSYEAIYGTYTPTTTAYDINYTTSPGVTAGMLTEQKVLIQRAADYWRGRYIPNGVEVLYITQNDGPWAANYIHQNHPTWETKISGGIQSWISNYNCGFALAFADSGSQVFVQCLNTDNQNDPTYAQVGPHEYAHWVQYYHSLTEGVGISVADWLIEGSANFHGLALGVMQTTPNLELVNLGLAQHATSFDAGLFQVTPGTLRALDYIGSGDLKSFSNLLDHYSGPAQAGYVMGTLVSEWLVYQFGTEKFYNWMLSSIYLRSGYQNIDEPMFKDRFLLYFGFNFDDLAVNMLPYAAMRAGQLKTAWNTKYNSGPTVSNGSSGYGGGSGGSGSGGGAAAPIETLPIVDVVPKKLTAPKIKGSFAVGKTITASPGVWTAASKVTVKYTWLACTKPVAASSKATTPKDCKVLKGSAANYKITKALKGKYLSVRISAKSGSKTAYSTPRSATRIK